MKRTYITILTLLCSALSTWGFQQPPSAKPESSASPQAKIHYAPDRDYDLLKIALELKTDYDNLTLSGTAVNQLAPLRQGLTTVVLDCGRNLSVDACAIEGQPAPFTRAGDKLEISAPHPLEQGRPVSIEVRYSVRDNSPGLRWIRSTPADPQRRGFWTIGQPENNRTWVPTWDYPNDFAVFESRVTVPADWYLVGNGSLQSETTDPGGKTRTFHWLMDQPCATYLLSLVAGPLDIVRDEWQGVPLLYSTPKGEGGAIKDTFGETPEMLTFYSGLFGVKYPWTKYAECVMYEGGGAMENVSATLFSDAFLADPRRGPHRSSPVVAHELVHQWLGDLVTYRDWGETWLGEGFAVLFGQLGYAEHWQGRNEFDHQLESVAQGYFSESRRFKRPLSTRLYAAPDDMYDNHSYLKGALVLHTLRRLIGEQAFLRGVRYFLVRHRNEPVDSHDLCRAMTEATGINVEPFFDQWVEKPGHPVLDYSWTWDGNKKEVALAVKQTQDTKDGTPVYGLTATVGLIADGQVGRKRVRIDQAEQVVLIGTQDKPEAVILDPDRDLLREIPACHWAASELLPIMRYAPDAVDRQEAMTRLLEGSPAEDTVEAVIAALRSDRSEFPVFRSLQKLADLGRSDVRPFFREEMSHAFISRRVEAIRAIGRMPKDTADVATLRECINSHEPYDVVRASLLALAGWDAPGNRDVFRKADKIAPQDKGIRFMALGALAKADAETGKPHPDPDPRMTQQLKSALTDISRGTTTSPLLTEGMRSLAGRPNVGPSVATWLKDEKSFTFLVRDDNRNQGLERRGAMVSRTLTYKLVSGRGVIYLSFYLTAEGKLADLDAFRE